MKKRTINEKDLRTFAMHLIQIKETYYFQEPIPISECIGDYQSDEEIVPLVFEPFLELPIIFPNEWYIGNDIMPLWSEDEQNTTVSSILEFFKLDDYQFMHMFCVGEQHPEIFGGKVLKGICCNSQTIGKNILELINKMRFLESDLMKHMNLN